MCATHCWTKDSPYIRFASALYIRMRYIFMVIAHIDLHYVEQEHHRLCSKATHYFQT